MKIVKEPTTKFAYAFIYSFDIEVLALCRSIKNQLGYTQFGFYEKAWRFNNLAAVDMIKEKFPNVEVDALILPDLQLFRLEKEKEKLRIKKAEELKKATDTNFIVNNIRGELYPYQKIGVQFLINNNGKALLADAPGVGKSFQALAYIAHNKISKTLIVCPASVKGAWESETEKWTRLKPFVINSKTNLTMDILNDHNIFIINYDILAKFLSTFLVARFDSLVVDECQYIKSASAKRSKCVKMIAQKIPSIILLSGTPLLNRPVELFNSLNLIDPVNWSDYYRFTKKFCNGHQGPWGYDVSGASNIEELQRSISHYFLRRTKDDVLKELPPKTFIDIPIELENGARSKYRYAEESFIEYLRDVKNKNREEINRSLSAETLTKLNELRILTSSGKVDTAKEIINNIMESGEKIVVFSVYNEPLNILKEHFKDSAVMLIGSTKEADRNKAISDFQNNDDKKIFLGGMKAAGAGITLTAAANVLLIDYPWTNADRDQAIDRIHRPGQTASHATIYQLIAKNTIDKRMQKILKDKEEIFNQLIENKKVVISKQTSLIDDLIKSFKK